MLFDGQGNSLVEVIVCDSQADVELSSAVLDKQNVYNSFKNVGKM